MIVAAEIIPIHLAYRAPLALRGGMLAGRDGFLLRCVDSRGHVGYGEALAWPGDSLGDLRAALEAACRALRRRTLVERLPPAAAFAVDTVHCDLAAQAAGIPRRHVLNLAAPSRVRVNALVDLAGEDTLVARLESLAREGRGCVKLKLGRADFAADLRLAQAVRARLPAAQLRGDANGAWTEGQALERLAALAPYGFEYIEEPVAGHDALVRLAATSPIPLAVDESLPAAGHADPRLLRVLKPTRLGDFAHTRAALEGAPRAVLTGTFDGPIATLMTAALAAAWLPASTFHGLDVASLYDADLTWAGDALNPDTHFERVVSTYGTAPLAA